MFNYIKASQDTNQIETFETLLEDTSISFLSKMFFHMYKLILYFLNLFLFQHIGGNICAGNKFKILFLYTNLFKIFMDGTLCFLSQVHHFDFTAYIDGQVRQIRLQKCEINCRRFLMQRQNHKSLLIL